MNCKRGSMSRRLRLITMAWGEGYIRQLFDFALPLFSMEWIDQFYWLVDERTLMPTNCRSPSSACGRRAY